MRWLVIVAFVLAACGKSKRHPPKDEIPGVTFNARASGVPGNDGWFHAPSKNGRFAIDMPSTYNDVEQNAQGAAGPVHVYSIASVDVPLRTKYAATRMVGKQTVGDPYDRLVALPGMLERKDIEFKGVKGIEARFSSEKSNAWLRAFVIADGLVILMIETTDNKTPIDEARAKRFFDSLELDAQPAPAGSAGSN